MDGCDSKEICVLRLVGVGERRRELEFECKLEKDRPVCVASKPVRKKDQRQWRSKAMRRSERPMLRKLR